MLYGKEVSNLDFKQILVEKIQATQHHPFLFIGAGFSRRYINTERWDDLLRYFCVQFSDNEFLYDSYASQISEQDYYGKQPKIASLLEKDYTQAVLTQESFSDFRSRYKSEIHSGISPLKLAISEHLSNKAFDNFSDEIIELNKPAKRNISGIITTNYDCLIEDIFNDYSVYIGQDELIFSDIYEIGEIYKIHGSVTKPDSIIITAEDYKEFEEKQAYLIAKILTIFLEYPIIFLGYSLQDRNIQNILKTISHCLTQEKLDILKERFIFIEYENGDDVSSYSQAFENGSRIEMTKIRTKNYLPIFQAINSVNARYNPKVLRELRKDIYSLVIDADHSTKIIATGFENIDKLQEDSHFVLGVGVSTGNGHLVKAEQIYEDIILDNQYFNPKLVVEEYLPELLKSNAGGLPMYKYLSDYHDSVYGRIQQNICKYTTIDSYLNDNLRAAKKNYRRELTDFSVNEIIRKEGEEHAYKKIYFLEETEINIPLLEQYLTHVISNNLVELKGNSELKRIIRIFDFIKYKSVHNKLSISANT